MPTFADLVQDLKASDFSFRAKEIVERFVNDGGLLTLSELRSLLDGSCGTDVFRFGSDKANLLSLVVPGLPADTQQADFEALTKEIGGSLMGYQRDEVLRCFAERNKPAASDPPSSSTKRVTFDLSAVAAAAEPDPESVQLLQPADVGVVVADAVPVATASAGGPSAPSLVGIADPDSEQGKATQTAARKTKTNSDFNTDLIQGAWDGDHGKVRHALDQGADVEAVGGDHNGTAINAAARNGHADIVCMLIEAGADLNAKNVGWGYTPLNQAAVFNRTECAQVLLAAGADATIKSGPGMEANKLSSQLCGKCAGGPDDFLVWLLQNAEEELEKFALEELEKFALEESEWLEEEWLEEEEEGAARTLARRSTAPSSSGRKGCCVVS